MDDANRNYIIEYKGHLGYKLLPYQMSSSELQFCQERIYTEISQKQQERLNEIDRIIFSGINNFNI